MCRHRKSAPGRSVVRTSTFGRGHRFRTFDIGGAALRARWFLAGARNAVAAIAATPAAEPFKKSRRLGRVSSGLPTKLPPYESCDKKWCSILEQYKSKLRAPWSARPDSRHVKDLKSPSPLSEIAAGAATHGVKTLAKLLVAAGGSPSKNTSMEPSPPAT